MESKAIYLQENIDEGLPESHHFEIKSHTVDVSALCEGDIAVQLIVLSADPYLRGQIRSTGRIKSGNVMYGYVAGKVIASNNSSWEVGDLFGALLPFDTIQIVTKTQLSTTSSWKLTGLISEDEISLGIGCLGMPGSTAYGGLIDILKPKPGEIIFISAASGAVGSLVGMLAKQLYGCTVIGSCGGPEKCALVKNVFGFDHAIDYKTISNADQLKEALKEFAPEGIDMYFENVGGMHFEAAINSLRLKGRIAICGQISEYNKSSRSLCAFDPLKMIYSFQRIQGFMCSPWLDGKKGNFLRDMHQYLREGKIIAKETTFQGIESWPEAFRSLFTGANICKVVVKL